MHVGALVMLEGPAPDFAEFLDGLRARLHLVPRYRQKLANPPLDTGRPLWVDDPDFNLEYHFRQTALPRPGTETQMMRLAARIMSQQLDRAKPLWELWLVEGLGGGGFSIILETHPPPTPRSCARRPPPPCSGGAGPAAPAGVMSTLPPGPAPPPPPDEPWRAQPEPTPAELVAG